MKPILSTTLHSTKDGSDKVYIPAIVPNPAGGFDVIFQNGPRGGTLTKPKAKVSGVDEASARAAYEKLVKEKIKGGYNPTDGEQTAVSAMHERDGKRAGIPVQLLTFIDESQVVPLIERGMVLQRKHDGERRLLVIQGDDVAGVNRQGEYVPLPPRIVDAGKALVTDAILDAEIIGDTMFVFDAQRIDGVDLTTQGFMARFVALKKLLKRAPAEALTLVPVFHAAEAIAEVERLREIGAEGLVLRAPQAVYQDGKLKHGPVKFKFWKSCSAFVLRQNDQHSVGVGVYRDGQPVDIGNVTLPPSMHQPALGTILEIRYLNFQRSLYQPTLLGVRSDLRHDDLTYDQLVHKVADL